jgi:hypothetical protein
MRAADLAAEMRAAAIAMELRDFAQLREMGITRLMAGIGRVRDVGDGLYEPEDSPWGHWRWITPVCVQFPDTPESTDPMTACDQLIDLVAWHEARPEHWLLRTGDALWLGAIQPQCFGPDPVHVWRSPLSWIRNGCIGLVPLSRKRYDINYLLTCCIGGVRAEDPAHAAQLRHILEYPVAHPPVSWRVQ